MEEVEQFFYDKLDKSEIISLLPAKRRNKIRGFGFLNLANKEAYEVV